MLNVGGKGPLGGLFRILFCGTVFSVVNGCGKLPGYATGVKTDAFTADVQLNPDIDMLFVIDNSGSMADNQALIASSFSNFITQFSDKGLHFHLGVITTDPIGDFTDMFDDKSGAGPRSIDYQHDQAFATDWWKISGNTNRYFGIFNGGMGTLLSKSADKFLTWETTDFISQFEANAQLGTHGSGSEMPILSVANALKSSALTTGQWNEGFIRSTAFLSVIVVTDEDETTYQATPTNNDTQYLHNAKWNTNGATQENDRIDLMLSSLEGLKGTNLDSFSFNAITGPAVDLDCDNHVNGSVDTRGLTLQKTVDTINANYPALGDGNPKAALTSICHDFSTDLVGIGSEVIQANARYTLIQLPAHPSDIKVYVSDVLVPRTTTDGWQYNSVGHFVQFYGTAIPSAGEHIKIDYVPLAPI